ncbi:MAG TPA: phosphoribosylaminoimidazolesuccinocarboxamide synthase [Ferruginibacter sp.]|jgi:phosphoribosylaminoimidazole-succinocarboxamide synthase|nr:phosphoribosylaminoimidazolesuccinocarboxamide synthase [Chitinophagaceae bacterium]MBP6372631.1 phosphoribosylaminoimidazolesuccinocarboxamide synthase [Ferruginibacter sp.]MBK8774848.1 phosphoribosylaminoimidazolesuccinocarboxamide synthase [Chitinophagaceae bacterium]MBK8928376.1 phosphoribosylaminoimidazolesuccinocarboxamide synthase [Chitinophagaceae bacterium]MBK9958376.1 phosphoribosylaminoimidazolesuccinocarboxamide synthase [Chitinophagaceae bacterium]
MQQFQFPGQTGFYSGKVRDVYTINDQLLVMVASNRISAFDVILPKPIPHKGQILNQLAAYMMHACSDICPHWLLETPAPNVSLGKKCEPVKVEMVVRGHLTGHAWRLYQSGKREICEVPMPDGLKENDAFPKPIITPTTKADAGHDEDISLRDILKLRLVDAFHWQTIQKYSFALFKRGGEIAAKQGLILADTKYEFGLLDDKIVLMDEIHTPDSSRYFYADGFEDRQQKGEKQLQLSKEFVREWLMANNFMGKEGQQVPQMSDQWIHSISRRYIELYEKITGQQFVPQPLSEAETFELISTALNKY